MEQLADAVADEVRDEYGQSVMVGVSYYDEEGVGHVFRSEWASAKYDPVQVDEIVSDLRLEALGHGAHESMQEQQLHATVRIYAEMLDIAVPLSDRRGIAVALDRDGAYSIRGVVDLIQQAVHRSSYELHI